ncbi:ankyrin repeat domain-containing protein [Bradyrhizobium sp. USDA 4529]
MSNEQQEHRSNDFASIAYVVVHGFASGDCSLLRTRKKPAVIDVPRTVGRPQQTVQPGMRREIQPAAGLRKMPFGLGELHDQMQRVQDHLCGAQEERRPMRQVGRILSVALALLLPSMMHADQTFAAPKKSTTTTAPRDETRDQKSIELATAIMKGDLGFKEIIPAADPNAIIYINYQGQKYDISLLTMAILLGDAEAISALLNAGAQRGESCNIRHLIAVSMAFNSILPPYTDRRTGLPRIMTGQAALSCFLAAPYRKAVTPSDQPLLDAIVAGKLDGVKRAVSRGADENAREQKLPGTIVWPGRSALMIAMIEGKFDIATFLIDRGADLNAKAAVASNWGGVDGIDALKIAITLRQHDALALLLKRGAKADNSDEDGNLAVHEAASRGDQWALQALLASDPALGAKASVVARNKSGDTPLVLAVRSHGPEVVSYLISRGRELYGADFLEYWGNGAVDEVLTLRFIGSTSASEKGDVRAKAGQILMALLSGGIDRTFKDDDGKNILMRALENGFDRIVIQAILDGKPPLDDVDRQGRDAYAYGRDRGDAQDIKDLLDRSRTSSP